MSEVLELKTPEEIKIYSDPYRLKIFYTFNRFGRPATSKEVADAMGEVPSKVYYHVKKLESIKLLKIVETREINGIVAKYYEPFKGNIRLKQEDIEPDVKKVYVSETQKLVQEMYEMSKRKFLDSIDSDSEHGSSQLTHNTLYLTKDEADKLMKDFEVLLTPYLSRRKGDSVHFYEIFLSLVMDQPVEDTDD